MAKPFILQIVLYQTAKSLDGSTVLMPRWNIMHLAVRICICNTPVVIILPLDRIIYCTVVVVLYLSPNACQYE